MPLRRATPTTFRARGVSDAVDGTNAFPGAMSSLSNLAPAPDTGSVFVPRPASVQLADFVAGGFTNPTQITAELVVGTRIYGMVSTSPHGGKDEPFCYDILAAAFIPVSGVLSANQPATQSTSGDWVPPVIQMITNSRIIITHPGFPSVDGSKFAWIDISSFSINTRTGNTTLGSPVIHSISGFNSSPIIDGIQPGMTITGAGIPAATVIVSLTNGTFSLTQTGDTHTSTLIDALGTTAGIEVGMAVTGGGIPVGATVATIAGPNSITISAATTSSITGGNITIAGGGTITMSKNATATATGIALAIAGGTPAAPLYGAGNTNTTPLASVPKSVGAFNGRAWYAVDNAAVFSDSLNPTQVSFASQALILGDNTPVTALTGLPLTSQVTGGSIQSLIAFKGAGPFFQITGDQATNNLAQNLVNGSVGTLAPRTIVATPLGLALVSPDGVRILGFAGTVSEPIGSDGKGVCVPFIFAINPSRMCAAFNQNTLRISCQNGAASGQPHQEWWFDFERKFWTGPHTFPFVAIQPYYGNPTAFIGAPVGLNGVLYISSATPQSGSVYTENGNPLTWSWQTTLLPDGNDMAMHSMVRTTLAANLPGSESIVVLSVNESGDVLDQVEIAGTGETGGVWGTSVWGAFAWGPAAGIFYQYRVAWHLPIVSKQMAIRVAGSSVPGFALGNLYMEIQTLGYALDRG